MTAGCCRVKRSSSLVLALDLERAAHVLASQTDESLSKELTIPRVSSAVRMLEEQLSRVDRLVRNKEKKNG